MNAPTKYGVNIYIFLTRNTSDPPSAMDSWAKWAGERTDGLTRPSQYPPTTQLSGDQYNEISGLPLTPSTTCLMVCDRILHHVNDSYYPRFIPESTRHSWTVRPEISHQQWPMQNISMFKQESYWCNKILARDGMWQSVLHICHEVSL